MFSQELIKRVSANEKIKPKILKEKLKTGRAVILFNPRHPDCQPQAVGEGLKVKVNTNLGLSTKKTDIPSEMEKLKVALGRGTYTVMDLSVSSNLKVLRQQLLKKCPKPLGTVPLYEVIVEAERRKGDINRMTFDDIWDVLNLQAKEGVDFFTIHAGILRKYVQDIKVKKRVCGIVSRGGSLLAQWMLVNKKENPFYENFDKILELAKTYNITISLGDALRPGAIADSTDKPQLAELYTLGKLVKRCREKEVQRQGLAVFCSRMTKLYLIVLILIVR